MKEIDFILLWVDGNDPEWQKEKARYTPDLETDTRIQRYRDWENLQYWFRGVEKFAPWVHKIYFVTWGHIPDWLNLDNPKLIVVKHEDYMPKEYLPVFNCNPLELNLHRINGISEQFVYFNDDMFLTNYVKENDFFINGRPCDCAVLNVHCYSEAVQFHFGYERAVGIINKYFDFHESVKKNWRKWFSMKNASKNFRTLVLLGCPRFPGIWQHHAPFCFLKSTYKEVWAREEKELLETTKHKFRHKLDLTAATMKAWQLAKGEFEPRRPDDSRSYMIQAGQDSAEKVAAAISHKKYKMVTVNDGDMTEEEYQKSKQQIIDAFESILPDKSSFEK